FTTGVASSAANVILNKNDIVTSGNNIGNASNCGDSIIAETTGIKIAYGNASVTNCTVKTTGENTVNTTGSGSVTYNYLVSNTGLGDKTVQSNNKTIVENNGPEFLLTVPELVKIYGSADKLTAILTDASHNPIANANITFTINGRNYTKTTNETGVASMNINLYPGVFTVSASYNDTTVNSTVIVTSSIIGDNIVKIFQNGTQFFATFYGKDGKPLANNTDVTFNINGVFYTRQTNENGTARLNINLIPGKYILTAINPANNEEKGFNVTVLSNVETANLVKYYKNESQFVVKVLNGDGTPANGTNVTFNINGVFYTRDVINGTATLNINLDPGNYTITTMYGKYSVGNNITVLPTLITEDLNMKFQDGSRFTAKALDGQGNPLANQTVFFNVNGVLYNRTTGADGFAKLLIRLNPGKYIITSIWNGYQVGRTITIS
ncbi:Ig-like domain-containing protein, partial [uncultured Methanobrevibacter sp.]